jgi:hypothetical protein
MVFAWLFEVDRELCLVGEVLSISEEPASLAALEESLGKYYHTGTVLYLLKFKKFSSSDSWVMYN